LTRIYIYIYVYVYIRVHTHTHTHTMIALQLNVESWRLGLMETEFRLSGSGIIRRSSLNVLWACSRGERNSVLPKRIIRCAKKKKIHVGGCTPGVLYEFRRDCIVGTPPIPLPHGAIYKTLISCDEELMDRRASPRTVDVIYWSMYNEVTSCNSPLQPLSGLRESASAKRDEDKLRTHPFRAALPRSRPRRCPSSVFPDA